MGDSEYQDGKPEGPWIFLDDSGDCGFKLDDGSSRHVVMAACIFRSRDAIMDAVAAVAKAASHVSNDGRTHRIEEFKYSGTKQRVKNRFFEAIDDVAFDVRAIVVDKQKIWSSRFRDHPENMKNYMIEQLLIHTFGTIDNGLLIIDGKDKREFKIGSGASLMQAINNGRPGTVRNVSFVDSKESPHIQIADMFAGSLRRSHAGCEHARKHVRLWSPRTAHPNGDIWLFDKYNWR